MDRQIVYTGAIPQDADLLQQNRNAMIALGYALQAILGSGTAVDGLACTPTTPASLAVAVGPGSICSLANLDASAYGSLAADTTHQILKQGLRLDASNLSCPAPATTGFSVVHLIQAAYQDVDGGAAVLPYYNASNPSQAYNGPNNTGVSQNTVRRGVCTVSVKTGAAAATGSQAIPSPDPGYTALWSVTVANGQTTITSGDIAAIAGAPFISEKLADKISTASGDARYLRIGAASGMIGFRNLSASSAGGSTATYAIEEAVVESALGGSAYKGSNLSKTLNLGATGAGGMDTGSAPTNGALYVYLIYNPTTSTFALLATAAGSGSTVYSGSNMPSGYTASALVGVHRTNGSAQFNAFTQLDREVFFLPVAILSGATGNAILTSQSIAAAVPVGARTTSGRIIQSQTGASGTTEVVVASDANGTAAQYGGRLSTFLGLYNNLNFRQLPLLTAQTIFWSSSDTRASSVDLSISSYTF